MLDEYPLRVAEIAELQAKLAESKGAAKKKADSFRRLQKKHDILKKAQDKPARVSKKHIEDMVSKYYKDHPNCRNRKWVLEADFAAIDRELTELKAKRAKPAVDKGRGEDLQSSVDELQLQLSVKDVDQVPRPDHLGSFQ